MSARRLHVLVTLAPLAVGAALLAEQVWLRGKAAVAATLIDRAFADHLEDGAPHPPWDWADTHPIARLAVPRLGIRRTVLAGSSGPSLAFGPGHLSGTAPPNRPGNCVLAGHRDSWFAFLRELRFGDEIRLRTPEGRRCYRVRTVEVRSMRDTKVLEPSEARRLTLITCYPFGALRRGELRFVVTCEEDACYIARSTRRAARHPRGCAASIEGRRHEREGRSEREADQEAERSAGLGDARRNDVRPLRRVREGHLPAAPAALFRR